MITVICFAPNQEVTLKDNELAALRKQIEREFLEKIKIEDNIMEKMRSQLTLDKAAQYTKKMTDKLRRRATDLVCKRGKLESWFPLRLWCCIGDTVGGWEGVILLTATERF